MTKTRTPADLDHGGAKLWKAIADEHEMDPIQLVTLLEACRLKDRLDKLDAILRGESESWMRLIHDTRTEDYELKIDDALSKANTTANLMKQLLTSLRLPDANTGKKPQQRGGARGAYAPTAKESGQSKVSSLDRARAARAGA